MSITRLAPIQYLQHAKVKVDISKSSPRRFRAAAASSCYDRAAVVDVSTVLAEPMRLASTDASFSSFMSREESQGPHPAAGRNRARRHNQIIPADTKSYVVAGQCEVQLSPDLVVGISTFGNSQYCQMTIEFHDSNGNMCTYSQWKAEQELTGIQAQQSHQRYRVASCFAYAS